MPWSCNTTDCDGMSQMVAIPGLTNQSIKTTRVSGPFDTTVADFWRMVWQEASNRIVMVANLEENGKVCRIIKIFDSKIPLHSLFRRNQRIASFSLFCGKIWTKHAYG